MVEWGLIHYTITFSSYCAEKILRHLLTTMVRLFHIAQKRLFCDVKKGKGNAATGNNSKVQSFGSVFNLLLSISLHIAFVPSFLLI